MIQSGLQLTSWLPPVDDQEAEVVPKLTMDAVAL